MVHGSEIRSGENNIDTIGEGKSQVHPEHGLPNAPRFPLPESDGKDIRAVEAVTPFRAPPSRHRIHLHDYRSTPPWSTARPAFPIRYREWQASGKYSFRAFLALGVFLGPQRVVGFVIGYI